MALEKQMELFEEGGLMQEGGTVDEESGNDVPTGSLKKEVRDDIPAQLSEGEVVMPADVVRFHGLDKMMALRDEAKMGLQRMEDMGQMGNAEEATIPDGVPFSMDDLDIEDEPVEMQVGGFVQPPVVGMPTPPPMPSQFVGRQPQYTPYQVPTYGGYQPPQPQAVPTAPTGLPSFSDFVTPKYELYVNDAGNTISIPVDANGNPLVPVPAGYKKQSDTTATTPTTPDTGVTPVITTAPTQREEDPSDGREFGGGPAGLTMSQSKRAVLEQLDPAFASQINLIKNKYNKPFDIIGEFKEGSEIRKALSGYDYDKLAADRGLTREELDDVLGDLANEVFTGYRDPVTGEVSGQKKPPRSFSEQLANLFGKEEETDSGDEFGNIADDGTMPASSPSLPGIENRVIGFDYVPSSASPTASGDTADFFDISQVPFGESPLDDVTVETTQTLAEEGSTAADAARNKIFELRDFQKNLGLSTNQSLDMLVALTRGYTGYMTFPTANNPEGKRLDFNEFSDESRVAAQTLVDEMLDKGNPEVKGQVAAAVTKYNTEDASRGAEDRSAAEAARLQAQILEEQRRRQQSQTNTGGSDDDGGSGGGTNYSVGSDAPGSFTAGPGYGGGRGFVGGFAEGGLASKPKPKAKKKMKQGGLASKK